MKISNGFYQNLKNPSIIYNKHFFIRQIRQTVDGINLISSNSDYETIKISSNHLDNFIILGKKVWRGS